MMLYGNIENRVRADNKGSIATKKAKAELQAELDREGVPTRKEISRMLREQQEEITGGPVASARSLNKIDAQLKELKAQLKGATTAKQIATFGPRIQELQDKLNKARGKNFSEAPYDFTRCVRPNGSAYGTGGKCRKGTEQELFESDGGIQTGASGGVIGGRLFGTGTPIKIDTKTKPAPSAPVSPAQPYKTLYRDLKHSVNDSKKLGFARNQEKVDALLKQANTLLERESGLYRLGQRDNAFKDLYEPLRKALDKVVLHGGVVQSHKARTVSDKLFESGVFWEKRGMNQPSPLDENWS
jgi:hypothetical protein